MTREKINVDMFMDQLVFGTDNHLRVQRIPKDVNIAIALFRNISYGLDENPEDIVSMVQFAGELVYYGQYGYVDLLNEHYVDLDKIESQVLDNAEMLKKDFFDEPLQESEPDYEWIANAVDEMYYIKLYLEITDHWDTEDALKKVNKIYADMRDICEKHPSILDYIKCK